MTRRGLQIVVTHSVVDALSRDILLRIAFLQIKTTGRRMGIVVASNLTMTGVGCTSGTQETHARPSLFRKNLVSEPQAADDMPGLILPILPMGRLLQGSREESVERKQKPTHWTPRGLGSKIIRSVATRRAFNPYP